MTDTKQKLTKSAQIKHKSNKMDQNSYKKGETQMETKIKLK